MMQPLEAAAMGGRAAAQQTGEPLAQELFIVLDHIDSTRRRMAEAHAEALRTADLMAKAQRERKEAPYRRVAAQQALGLRE
jgi:hypothetical protein